MRFFQSSFLVAMFVVSLSGTSYGYYNSCRPDYDLDSKVGFADLSSLLSCWGLGTAACVTRDVNSDLNVGFADLSALLAAWGDCPLPRNQIVGEQKLAVVLLDYDNDGGEQTVEKVQDGLFDKYNSIKNYIEEISYDNATISGDIFGWYHDILYTDELPLLGVDHCYPPGHMIPGWLANQGIDVHAYDGVVVLVNYTPTGPCTYGHSSLGKRIYGFTTPEGGFDQAELFISLTRMDFAITMDYSRTSHSTLAHELLHGFGLPLHADALVCGDESISLDMSNCFLGNGWDAYDMMGLRTLSSHPSMTIKEVFGWLEEGDQEIVEASGQFTIAAREKANVDDVRSLRIQLPEAIDTPSNYNHKIRELVLEYSGRTGFDARTSYYDQVRLTDGSYYQIPSMYGVQIRGVDCQIPEHPGYCDSFLIDAFPDSIDEDYEPWEFHDALLTEGATFVEPNSGIEIHVDTISATSSATVSVTF